MIKRILVIGKNGQLGCSLQKVLKKKLSLLKTSPSFLINDEVSNFSIKSFFFISRDELDLSKQFSINNFFQNQNFAAIVNCAAYTSVDKAEEDSDLAEKINHLAVGQLAKIAKSQSIPLIHISTDYVFDGLSFKPYKETDVTDPQNNYGLTKLKGEKAIIASRCSGAIIRTSWLYSEFGNNFVTNILRLGRERESLNIVADQVGSPTYATNLAKLLLIMLNNKKTINILNSQLNLYHFSDEGKCSWYDLTKAIFNLSNISCNVIPIKSKDFSTLAKRPNYSVMNKDKIKNYITDLSIPHWQESLTYCLEELKNKHLLSS